MVDQFFFWSTKNHFLMFLVDQFFFWSTKFIFGQPKKKLVDQKKWEIDRTIGRPKDWPKVDGRHFSEKMLISTRCIRSFMSKLNQKILKVLYFASLYMYFDHHDAWVEKRFYWFEKKGPKSRIFVGRKAWLEFVIFNSNAKRVWVSLPKKVRFWIQT